MKFWERTNVLTEERENEGYMMDENMRGERKKNEASKRLCHSAHTSASTHSCVHLADEIYWCRGAAKCAGKWARPTSSDVNHLRPRLLHLSFVLRYDGGTRREITPLFGIYPDRSCFFSPFCCCCCCWLSSSHLWTPSFLQQRPPAAPAYIKPPFTHTYIYTQQRPTGFPFIIVFLFFYFFRSYHSWKTTPSSQSCFSLHAFGIVFLFFWVYTIDLR